MTGDAYDFMKGYTIGKYNKHLRWDVERTRKVKDGGMYTLFIFDKDNNVIAESEEYKHYTKNSISAYDVQKMCETIK